MVQRRVHQSTLRLMRMKRLKCWQKESLLRRQHQARNSEGANFLVCVYLILWEKFLRRCHQMDSTLHRQTLWCRAINVALLLRSLSRSSQSYESYNWPSSILHLLDSEGVMKFESMPLSAKTRYSLKVAKLEIATEIQAAAIPHALAGRYVNDGVRCVTAQPLPVCLYCDLLDIATCMMLWLHNCIN